jgi:ABC-2 type transport system permease protein
MSAFGQVVRNEARLVRRQPTNMIGSIGLPVVLMIIFGELPSFHQHISVLGGLPLFDTYVPIIMVLGLTMLTLLGLPGPLVSYRELGILRRLSTTPVPPSWLLAAQVVVQLCIALAGLAIVNIASVAAFGAPVPKSPAGLALSCLLAISNYTPLGAAVEAIQGSMQTGFPPATPLLVLAGYTLVFAYLARRFFRWE